MEKLSKERAVELHREMWGRIARKHEEGKMPSMELKREVLIEMGYDPKRILFYSFCCEYTDRMQISCSQCPINWETEITPYTNHCSGFKEDNGLFDLWLDSKTQEEAIQYAKTISKLPEKNTHKNI